DSRLRLDPGASRRFGPERTGERMLGAAQRHADEKTWHVVSARPVLIHDEHDELVSHCVASKRSRHRSPCLRYHLPHRTWLNCLVTGILKRAKALARTFRAFYAQHVELAFDVAEDEVCPVARAYSITSSARQ